MMPFGGVKKFQRYARWLRKKNFQVFIRTGLSHTLAIVLALLVIVRESHELTAMFGFHVPVPPLWLVIVVTVGTVGVAVWEFVANKLKISHQEILFLYAMRTLQDELERLLYAEEDDKRDPNVRLKEFLDGALNIISETFSARSKSDAGLMVKLQNAKSLRLVRWSKEAKYKRNLEVPVAPEQGEIKTMESTGPAGVAFSRLQTIYVPEKKREVWPFRREHIGNKEWYQPSEPVICWISAEDESLEDFRSVLCVPIVAYRNQHVAKKFGVLNLSTKMRDPFVDRDFLMAECFASVLASAFAWARVSLRGRL